ncbi:MAG TPA: TonB-dependent receptor plug domain-containing protein, partial [Niastella sp.]|nr:TonB-dependent receptor plug domain-containing protein [Niastella sp.]
MNKAITLCIALLLACINVQAQHTIAIAVKKKDTNEPLASATATIKNLNKTIVADSAGLLKFNHIAAGTYTINVTFAGLKEKEIKVTVPQPINDPVVVFLTEDDVTQEEVVVQATRTSRTIANIPTRVEVVSGEELAEKGNMKPGEMRMLLSESTGIQTQQTSATSNSSSIRIQGLDGRYTQILKDGYPLYAGFSGGLSIMQIVPLDLRQVEVIKGSSSTLYGGGAIAGLVNLVSKVPTDKRELNFLANATSAKGLDLSGFY